MTTSRQAVSRKTFAVIVGLLVLSVGAADLGILRLEHAQAHKSSVRNNQLCAVISQLPADPIVLELRGALGCPKRMPQKPATSSTSKAPAARQPSLPASDAPQARPTVVTRTVSPSEHSVPPIVVHVTRTASPRPPVVAPTPRPTPSPTHLVCVLGDCLL